MHIYRQPIILFGIVLPIVAAAALIGVGVMVKNKMTASFDNKQATYKTYEQSRLAGLEVESQVARQRTHLERWQQQLAQETASTVATNLREITEKLPNKEIQQTAFERSATSGFASSVAQNSSQIRIAFRGTYRSLQRAFLELETRMPQLQLQDLKIDPISTQSSQINCQVTYTAWEN